MSRDELRLIVEQLRTEMETRGIKWDSRGPEMPSSGVEVSTTREQRVSEARSALETAAQVVSDVEARVRRLEADLCEAEAELPTIDAIRAAINAAVESPAELGETITGLEMQQSELCDAMVADLDLHSIWSDVLRASRLVGWDELAKRAEHEVASYQQRIARAEVESWVRDAIIAELKRVRARA